MTVLGRKQTRIDQLVTNVSFGDAITNHCLEIRRALRNWGYSSDIFAQHIDERLKGEAFAHTSLSSKNSESALVLLHHSIGSDIVDVVMANSFPTILIYHNITPPQFFASTNPHLRHLVAKGRDELIRLRERACAALGDSEFNRLELVEAGFRNTGVLPIIVDFEKYNAAGSRRILDMWRSASGSKLLFVGRISPHKKQDDIINAFNYYKKCIAPDARLFLVGSHDGTEQYLARLKYLVSDLGLRDVVFSGQITFEELLAYYRVSDVFLCMSEHEGFCVPLLEAMHFGLPIIAFKSTAIPYTLGDAGILFTKKQYDVVAELANLLVTDQKFKEQVVNTQRERLGYFSKENTLKTLKDWIEQVIP